MSRKSYATHLLVLVAILVVGPSAGILVALPECNQQRNAKILTFCRYTDLFPCLVYFPEECAAKKGQAPLQGNWGGCSDGLLFEYCAYPQESDRCYEETTCKWDAVSGMCVVDAFVRYGWWIYARNYACGVTV